MKKFFCKTRLLWGILLGLCYYFGQSYVTLAHAELVKAAPAPGETVTAPPEEIRLEFNEPIGAESTFIVFDRSFNSIEGIVETDSQNSNILTGREFKITRPGIYTVQWVVFSADGHTIDGTFEFAVETGSSEEGDHKMELIAVAESTAVNLPGWFAWIMVGLALVVPFAVWNMTQKK